MRWKMKMIKIKKMIKYDEEEMNGENAQNTLAIVLENLTG